MRIHYLEIVTPDADGVRKNYEATFGISFGDAVPELGGARTTSLPDGSLVGVRAPMSTTEEPIVRPYWLVDDMDEALLAAQASGGEVAHPALDIPGYGKFAIYRLGDVLHGLWQL